MLSLIVFLMMFGTAFLTALLAVSFYWASMHVRARRAGTELVLETGEHDSNPHVIKEADLSTIKVWALLLERFSHVEELRAMIAEANLRWSVGRVTLMMLLGGTATGTLLWQTGVVPLLPSALIVSLVVSAPYLYLRRVRRKRFETFSSQFPEALDSMTRALKAGYPLSTALELLALEQPEPLSSEMRRTREEWNLGVGWDQALNNLADRIPVPEVRLFVAAVKMQNRVGGRLNDVLGRLGETMRDNTALEGEVRAVSAHSRITGTVLTIVPVVIGLLMFVANPEYMTVMLRRPEGRTMLGLAALANIAAHFVIKRVAQVRA
ncbi:type II secretion system F family protein [uncultured Paludibaculum sp.]|uniref:type II secretion system F family protein n=1 Tax=uncultured Paludibaculum sp. TaxID=1765020 RepID=UPI002AAB5F6E|nr:type II secretion system F family protein [uncultured Paludibaculum sp.]